MNTSAMKRTQFNSLPTFGSTNINVDREKDILRNVCMANFGKNKNNSYFDEKFISDLVAKGNAQTQGVKSRFGHPSMCATSLGSYIGRYKNFRVENGNCFADLHLDPLSKKTQVEGKGIFMYDYIMDMAERNPDMFGNSIHITYIETPSPKLVEGFEVLELNDITASDLVDDPAATSALFSSNPEDLGVLVTDFLDNNPALFESINQNPNIIEDFFERYFAYQKRKFKTNFNMSFLDKLKKQFSSAEDASFDIDVTLADGSIVKVITEAEQPQEGDEVVDSTGAKVADAEHLLPDGSAIVTVNGLITEIKDKPEPAVDGEPTMAEVMNSINVLGANFKAFQNTFAKVQKENEAAFGLIAGQVAKFDKDFTAFKKTVKSKTYEAPGAEEGNGKGNAVKGYDPVAAAEAREKRNQTKN